MKDRNAPALIAETIGTFLFFFVGVGSVVLGDYLAVNGGASPGLLGVALAHGLVLAVLVSALGPVSGGHFNPAVTLAVWITGKITPSRAAMFVVAQLIGAALAGFALRSIFPTEAWQPSYMGTPALGPGITPVTGIAIEAVLTALLVLVVIGTAVDHRAPKIGGLAIGLAVAADILMGGPLTGAAMNPARAFGAACASGVWTQHWIYWIAPLLGGAAAARMYKSMMSSR